MKAIVTPRSRGESARDGRGNSRRRSRFLADRTEGGYLPVETNGETTMKKSLAPDRVLQLGLAFWGSKTLLSALELGLFTELAKGPKSGEALRNLLGLHSRSARDFFDALVALGVLDRKGDKYRNTPETDLFLDRN